MIIEKVLCPRCNADAFLKVLDHGKDNFYIIFLDCDKCKSHIYQGFITREEFNKKKVIYKLKNLLKTAITKEQEDKLLKKLEELEEKK